MADARAPIQGDLDGLSQRKGGSSRASYTAAVKAAAHAVARTGKTAAPLGQEIMVCTLRLNLGLGPKFDCMHRRVSCSQKK